MTRQWSVFLEDHPLVLTPLPMRPTFPRNYDTQGFAQTKRDRDDVQHAPHAGRPLASAFNESRSPVNA
jgi:hypothetical protein